MKTNRLQNPAATAAPTRHAARPASQWYAELSEHLPAAYVAAYRLTIEAYRQDGASPTGAAIACRLDHLGPALCPADYSGPLMAPPRGHPADRFDGLG